ISAAKAQEQLQNAVGKLGTSSAMGAFERMEEKVLMAEARAQSTQELVGNDLDQQFAALEAGSDVDDELMAMKAQLTGTPQNQAALPGTAQPSTSSTKTPSNSAVDKDLEELKRQMDQL
ncbi:MAG: PspA/IM30 family protein, partial [Phormidium sp.]